MGFSFTKLMLMLGALSIIGSGGWMSFDTSKAEAAQWLAPAPHQELAAKWVEEVDRELRQPQYRNVLMNIPFGTPQATIIDLLNEAAFGLQNDEPQYALKLVRQAVNVLDETAGEGWYSHSEVRPIQALILRKAKQGFKQAGYNLQNRHLRTHASKRSHRMDDQERWRSGGARLFNPAPPNQPRDRYEDYTSEHWQSGYRPRIADQTRDLESERRQNLLGPNIRDREQFAQKRFQDPRRMRGTDRTRERGRFSEEEWREHARQVGEDMRGMRNFDRNQDRNRFSNTRFDDSRRMKDFDRNRDRFSQFGESRGTRDFDRGRYRGR